MKWRILLGIEVLLLILSGVFSYSNWGYVVRPPGPPQVAKEVSSIVAGSFLSNPDYEKDELKSKPIDLLQTISTLRIQDSWREQNLIPSELPELDPDTLLQLKSYILSHFGSKKIPMISLNRGNYFTFMMEHPKLGPLYYISGNSGQITGGEFIHFESVFKKDQEKFISVEEVSYFYDTGGVFYIEIIFLFLNILTLAVLVTLVVLGAGLKLCIFLTTKLIESYPKFAERFFKPKYVVPTFILALFFTAWFIPIHAENCGECPIRRLRFSVYTWDGVGETDQVHYKDILFSFNQVGVIWWGAQGAHKKIGGFWEYIGVKPINCRY